MVAEPWLVGAWCPDRQAWLALVGPDPRVRRSWLVPGWLLPPPGWSAAAAWSSAAPRSEPLASWYLLYGEKAGWSCPWSKWLICRCPCRAAQCQCRRKPSENLPEYDGRPAHGTVLGPHAIGKVGPRDREVGKVMRWR
jgi:hypothetical protein